MFKFDRVWIVMFELASYQSIYCLWTCKQVCLFIQSVSANHQTFKQPCQLVFLWHFLVCWAMAEYVTVKTKIKFSDFFSTKLFKTTSFGKNWTKQIDFKTMFSISLSTGSCIWILCGFFRWLNQVSFSTNKKRII